MLIITVEDSAFRAKLEKLQASLDNLTPVMSEIGDRLEEKTRQRFETRTDPNGVPWKPWAESTHRGYPWPNAKTKERLEYGPGNARLLDRYGTMRGSLNHQADANSVTVGFANDYAVFHELGAPNNKMPRRGMLLGNPTQGSLGADDEADVLDIVNHWLEQQVGE